MIIIIAIMNHFGSRHRWSCCRFMLQSKTMHRRKQIHDVAAALVLEDFALQRLAVAVDVGRRDEHAPGDAEEEVGQNMRVVAADLQQRLDVHNVGDHAARDEREGVEDGVVEDGRQVVLDVDLFVLDVGREVRLEALADLLAHLLLHAALVLARELVGLVEEDVDDLGRARLSDDVHLLHHKHEPVDRLLVVGALAAVGRGDVVGAVEHEDKRAALAHLALHADDVLGDEVLLAGEVKDRELGERVGRDLRRRDGVRGVEILRLARVHVAEDDARNGSFSGAAKTKKKNFSHKKIIIFFF